MICDNCKEEICPHGLCYCGDSGFCRDCDRRKQLEFDADREAAWQREVIGPMFGFKEEG